MQRRTLLATAAGAVAPAARVTSLAFRGYLGWITDLATHPDTNAAWPSMRLDEALLKDYRETFERMSELGLQDLCVWGLYVSRAWRVIGELLNLAQFLPRLKDVAKIIRFIPCPSPKVYCPGDSCTWNRRITQKSKC
jgi:hypothetical protein